MTILIQKAQSNTIALSNCLDNAIYTDRTYKFKFICDQSKVEQELVLLPIQNLNRFEFTLVEGTDITFDYLGFYNWELYEVEDITLNVNLLCEGKMKVIEVRTEPTTPTALEGNTFVVYDK